MVMTMCSSVTNAKSHIETDLYVMAADLSHSIAHKVLMNPDWASPVPNPPAPNLF